MLLENYYHILWLDTSSSQKQISKRAKDILKYLAIWETPEFENDFYFTQNYRNEIYVKLALDNLSKPKEKLINSFFWFDVESEDDKKIFRLVNDNDFDWAIEIFKNSNNKKNLAILYSLLLLNPNTNNKYISLVEETIQIFKDISEDEKFWKVFEKKYFLFDDISTNKELIQDFKNDLWKYLSNLFYDISSKLNDDSVLKIFHQYFKNSKWNKTNEQVEKIYLELNKLSQKLQDMNISDDGIFDDDEKNIVIKINEEILDLLEKLKNLWLYDDSKTLLIRDKVAEAFRTIMLDLNNELDEKNEALKIVNYALAIVGTDWLKYKINEEYKTITANIKLKPIIQLLDNEDFIWAYKKIEELEKEDLNKEDIKSLKNLKKRSIFWRLWKWFLEWKNLFDKEKYIEALKYFISIEELAKNNVKLFEWINPEWLNNILNDVREYLVKVENWKLNAKEVLEHIDTIRAEVLEKLSEEDGYFFIFYIDSITYWSLSRIIINKKKKEWWSGRWWLIFFWIIILISIFSDDSSNSSNYNTSTSNDSSNSSNEYNLWEYRCYSSSYNEAISMKPVDPWLDYMANEIDKLQNELDNTYVNEYSQTSVDSYNLKVTTLKSKINTYNSELESYNEKVDNYNNFLENNCYK